MFSHRYSLTPSGLVSSLGRSACLRWVVKSGRLHGTLWFRAWLLAARSSGTVDGLTRLAGGSGCLLTPSRDVVVQNVDFQLNDQSLSLITQTQCYTVDQLAWGSMKNAAKCVT